MATRSKTVEFVYPVNIATLAANTKRTFTGKTIYLPEGSKVFRSVVLEATWTTDATIAYSSTNWILGVKLGAVAESTATTTATITNSGESIIYRFREEFTSYFAANWTGTSMTWEASTQMAVSVTQNHSVKLIITYEYDDTTTTHVKTIRVPVESTRALMTTAYQTLGGATAIPAIGGAFIPENTPVIRQVWVELWGNTADITTATDWISTARINGGTTIDWFDQEAALLSGLWAYGIIDITAEDLTAARSLEIIVTGITSRLTQMGGMVCVTYEFNSSATTTVFNSLMLDARGPDMQAGGSGAGDEHEETSEIYINEPGTITMQPSGVCLFLTETAGFTLNVAVGSQTETAFAFTTATTQNGQFSLVHRIDAAGAKGTAGMTLARGPNTYTIKTRTGTTALGRGVSGFILLNYTSSKATAGVGAHAQSRFFHFLDTGAFSSMRSTVASPTAFIPESFYRIVGTLANIEGIPNGSGSPAYVVAADFERLLQGGWGRELLSTFTQDPETGLFSAYGSNESNWLRWPGDMGGADREDIEASRSWRMYTFPGAYAHLSVWTTWHSHTWTIAGTVSGYVDADGAGLTVKVYRASDDEHVLTLTTTAGGAFTTPWVDDTEAMYVAVFEDGTHVGRSANLTAV